MHGHRPLGRWAMHADPAPADAAATAYATVTSRLSGDCQQQWRIIDQTIIQQHCPQLQHQAAAEHRMRR